MGLRFAVLRSCRGHASTGFCKENDSFCTRASRIDTAFSVRVAFRELKFPSSFKHLKDLRHAPQGL